jgi:hypothetical protein
MRRYLIAFAAVALLGCSKSSTGPSTTSTVGTYTLVSVGGVALPAPSGDPGQTVTAGNLVLNADGSFTYAETRNPGGVQSSGGTYTVTGVNISLVPTSQGDTGATGVFSDGNATVTVTPSGQLALVLKKQ